MEEKTINNMDLVINAWRRIWVIILVAIIVAGTAFGYCKLFLDPKYTATASILVTNGAVTTTIQDSNGKTTDKISGSDISASLLLTHSIVDVLNTYNNYEAVAKQIEKEIGKKYTATELMSKSTVARRSEDTLFIDIKFTSNDKEEAKFLANSFGKISCQYIPNIIPNAEAGVVSSAYDAPKTYPRTTTATAVAGLAGAVIAYIVLFIIESTNRSIKGEEDFTNTFDVPLLGAVPDFENAEQGGYRKLKGKGGYSNGY